MSKNVAVFVDVANIFYAAKAAGVDIDYVTLLKAATAGRDFVRAYAYTGLDPENDNQRQFHAFLARNNYKVISKDIRKYGDGRIKANFDIELVVDMMKTARNLDIAVVVSGDGDFASAIRAVQEMGVRVEVISFRGNTSSDLIDVADLFTDIAQIARVDKSGRSGRRVAAEGDLSMTEVPEKETEGAPRRRRGARVSRDERPQVEEPTEEHAGNLVALPGERLSRAVEVETDLDGTEDDEAALAAGSANGAEPLSEEARRRRRRRGGRGRGRGRRPRMRQSPAAASHPPSTRTRRSTKNCPRRSRRYIPSDQSGTASWAFRPARPCRQPLILAAAAASPTKRTTTSLRCLSTCSPSVVSTVSARASTGAVAPVAVEIGALTRPPWIASAMADRDRPSRTLVAVAIVSRQVATGTGTARVAGRLRADARRTADRGHLSVTTRATLVQRAMVGGSAGARADAPRRVGTQVAPAGSDNVVELDAVAAVESAPAKPARKPRATTAKATKAKTTTAKSAPAAEEAAETPAPAKRTTRARTSTKSATASAAAAEAPTEAASTTEAKKPTRRRTTKSTPAAEEG